MLARVIEPVSKAAEIEHLDSAHDEAELEALKAKMALTCGYLAA